MTDDVIPLNKIGKIGTVKVYNQAYVDKQQKQIVELEKENTELKEQLEMSNKVYNDNLDYSHHIEEQLTKAKELLKKIYNFEYGIEADFPKFDLVKWSIETRDFLKDSEVEK